MQFFLSLGVASSGVQIFFSLSTASSGVLAFLSLGVASRVFGVDEALRGETFPPLRRDAVGEEDPVVARLCEDRFNCGGWAFPVGVLRTRFGAGDVGAFGTKVLDPAEECCAIAAATFSSTLRMA